MTWPLKKQDAQAVGLQGGAPFLFLLSVPRLGPVPPSFHFGATSGGSALGR
jgi:hypothetical protein